MNFDFSSAADEKVLVDLSTSPAACSDGNDGNLVDLRNLAAPDRSLSPELLKLGESETSVQLFTAEGPAVTVHFIPYDSAWGYSRCLGQGCILCGIGNKASKRYLLPVYNMVEKNIGILSVTDKMRPYDLLPQLMPYLKQSSVSDLVFFLSKTRHKYQVTTRTIDDTVDRGEGVIKQYLEDREQGLHDPLEVYRQMSNEELLFIPEVEEAAKLKGLNLS